MKKIAIIGAGISGLSFANLLRQDSNYDITIYEKNNFINLEKGYGIQLSVNSVKLLNKIGFQNIDQLNKFNPDKTKIIPSGIVKKRPYCGNFSTIIKNVANPINAKFITPPTNERSIKAQQQPRQTAPKRKPLATGP